LGWVVGFVGGVGLDLQGFLTARDLALSLAATKNIHHEEEKIF